MKFIPLSLSGAYLIEMEEIKDERGSFSRQFCQKEFQEKNLELDIKQCNISRNYKKGTLRGMHFQKEPYAEIKLVSCMKGAIFDVLVDLRKDSPTYLHWEGYELSESNNRMLYIPRNFAHGFQTLVDNTLVYYQMGDFFNPKYASGIRWNDPKINILWPDEKHRIINERDNNYELIA